MLRQGEGSHDGGPGDRVPLFEMSVDRKHREAILGRPISGLADEVAFWQAAGYDFVSTRAGVRSVVRGYHPAVAEWKRARHRPGPRGGWISEDAALIADRRDFESFPWPAPHELGGYGDYADLEEHLRSLARQLPDGMKVLVQLGYLFMGTWQLMGFENFCLKLADEPDLVDDLVNWLGASQLAVLEILLQHDCVGTVWLPDDLAYNSGPVVAPRFYRRAVYPWYARIVERCQAIDEDHPRDIERCAREAARDCACPCIASEDRICNALASSVSEAMFRSGYCR